MKIFFLTSIINEMGLLREKQLYFVEPINENVTCWKKEKDIPNYEKAIILSEDEIKKIRWYASLVTIENQYYWKLYTKTNNQVEILYVKSADLNPKYMCKM